MTDTADHARASFYLSAILCALFPFVLPLSLLGLALFGQEAGWRWFNDGSLGSGITMGLWAVWTVLTVAGCFAKVLRPYALIGMGVFALWFSAIFIFSE